MKKLLLLNCSLLFILSFGQQKKKDSLIYEYKPRIFYPYDCSCLGKVIYKEAKPEDKDFNP
ncbi:hypothetical protein [Chryseobacterium bernardetii]|uniref:hypothetical protein n=1 Tax=Chryseobacterium bernardetii TaxID=1241978 RepID=UPI0030180B3A